MVTSMMRNSFDCKWSAPNIIGVAVHFSLVKRLDGVLPKALVGVVIYGCINMKYRVCFLD